MSTSQKNVIFIHGAGKGAYKEDKILADDLQQHLGENYKVIYPEMPDEENVPYDQWKDVILQKLKTATGDVFLAGHSVGGSIIAKALSEETLPKPVQGIFLMATPFWGGDGWKYEGYKELEVTEDLAEKLKDTPMFLYHCQDDETVPFAHLALFSRLLPKATVSEISEGGHQLGNDLALVADDIKSL